MDNTFVLDDDVPAKTKNPVKTIRVYKCIICQARFLNKTTLSEHKLIHTSIKPFECMYCDYKSSLKDIMRNHINIQHGVLLKSKDIVTATKYDMIVQEYLCTICNGHYATKQDLHDHHIINISCKPSECKYCDENSASINDNMLNDMSVKEEIISDDDSDVLEENGSENIDGDARRMTIYKCTMCTKQFQNKSCLYKHNSSHYNLKSFGCQHCNYRCSLKGIMKNHLEIRHGISMKAADILTDNKYKMYIRAYRCPACNQVLSSMYRLKQHLIKNKECKPYKCRFCDYKSSLRSALNRHMESKHRDNVGGRNTDVRSETEGVNNSWDGSADDTQDFKIDIGPNSITPNMSIKEEMKDGEDFNNLDMKFFCFNEDVDMSKNSPPASVKEETTNDENLNNSETNCNDKKEVDLSEKETSDGTRSSSIGYFIEENFVDDKVVCNTYIKEEIVTDEKTLELFRNKILKDN